MVKRVLARGCHVLFHLTTAVGCAATDVPHTPARVAPSNTLRSGVVCAASPTGSAQWQQAKTRPHDHWPTESESTPFCSKQRWHTWISLFKPASLHGSLPLNSGIARVTLCSGAQSKRLFRMIGLIAPFAQVAQEGVECGYKR